MEHLTPVQHSPKKPRSDRVKIRKATAADKAPIMDICKNIWNGHDYLPGIWDDCLADKDGRLIVATVNRRTAGFGHASLETADVACLQGDRIDERYGAIGLREKRNV